MKDDFFNSYIEKISQRVDWLVTTCINAMTQPVARESAREHLNSTIKEILQEVYEVGFTAGEKKAGSDSIQAYKAAKYRLEDKLKAQLRTEIIDEVFKKYGIDKLRNKDKLKSKLEKKNDNKMEKSLEQQDL